MIRAYFEIRAIILNANTISKNIIKYETILKSETHFKCEIFKIRNIILSKILIRGKRYLRREMLNYGAQLITRYLT